MQHALHNEDQRVWEAAKFAALPPNELERMRRNLSCVECTQFAWFRKKSVHGHPAHFCAHHLDSCSLRVEYVVSGERDGQGSESDQIASSESIVVRLDQEVGAAIASNVVQNPDHSDSWGMGTRYISQGGGREASQHFTLRRILYRLVQSPTFRGSNAQIALYRNEGEAIVQGGVNQIAVSFSEITRDHHGRTLMYWGPIASAGRTQDEKVWLNSSASNGSASVAVFEDIAEEFMRTFEVEDLEDLAGAHVLVVGSCQFAGTGKPVIWCGSPKFVVVRKYRDAD